MTMALSHRESSPYKPMNGNLHARTQAISTTSSMAGSVARAPIKAPVLSWTLAQSRAKEDDDSAEKRDLAHVEWREAEISEAFPHQRISRQHDREEREISVVLQMRAPKFCFERVRHRSLRAGIVA